MATQLAPQDNPGWDAFLASLTGLDEVEAMSRTWDALADVAFDFTTDRYERTKAQFYRLARKDS